MTLKLVGGNEVSELPVVNAQDIAACARNFADLVESGHFGRVLSALIVFETDDTLETEHWGEILSLREAIGTFDIAKAHFIAKVIGDGE